MKKEARPEGKPIGLGAIAEATGVSRMAVSLALRNSPRISAATRKRVQTAARRLGYRRDAEVDAYLLRVRGAKSRTPILLAWLNAGEEEDAWTRYPQLLPYLEGARERAATLGYRLDEFWLRARGMTSRRLSAILYQRGIQGVLITPPQRRGTFHLRLDWAKFACASFEKALLAPRIHRAAPDYFYNLTLALKKLRRLGYRRIGVYLSGNMDRRSHHAYRAALADFQAGLSAAERVPPFTGFVDASSLAEQGRWLRRYLPDAVVGQHSRLVEWIELNGFRVPEQIGVAHLNLEGDCNDWAGIRTHKREIGAAAVDLVVSMLRNNELGLPAMAHDISLTGSWQPGRTLRTPHRD